MKLGGALVARVGRVARRGLARVDLAGRVRALATRALVLLGQRDRVQAQSDGFWRSSSNTYLASPAYYEERQRVLEATLAAGPRFRRAIDVGCGDGRFSLVLAGHADSVVGFDIAPALIERARESARRSGIVHATFEVAEIDALPRDRDFDLVTCMGVTSCVIDPAKLESLLDRLRALTSPGGTLLMVDSLAVGKPRTRAYRSGYTAHYRTAERYVDAITRRGFVLRSRQVIQAWSGISNELMVFALPSPSDGRGEPR